MSSTPLDDPPGYPRLPPGSTLEVVSRGRRMFVRDQEGSPDRPPVLLLHGLASTADLCWFATFPYLSGRHRAVAPDLRGHGDSYEAGFRKVGAPKINLEDVADDVAALIDQLDLSSVIVGGFSMGGVIAQLVWRRRRSAVAGLVLCATSADFRPQGVSERAANAGRRALLAGARMLPAAVRREMEVQIGRIGKHRTVRGRPQDALHDWAASQYARNAPLGILAAEVALRSTSTKDWVGDIDVPTALMVPTGDLVVPVADQLALARSIPGATVLEFPGPHGAFAECPDLFADSFSRALASVTDSLA